MRFLPDYHLPAIQKPRPDTFIARANVTWRHNTDPPGFAYNRLYRQQYRL
jgi:hypothetical protein